MVSPRSLKPSRNVTEAWAVAQRAKLDAQTKTWLQQAATKTPASKPPHGRKGAEDPISKRRAATTVERAVADFLDDHEGGNHSPKTLEWHRTALGFFSRFLAEERSITLVAEIDAPDISAWFASMPKTPASRGHIRSERTIQTYAPLLPIISSTTISLRITWEYHQSMGLEPAPGVGTSASA